MSMLNVQIEDRLNSAGYKTERIGGVVNAFDPIYKSVPGSSELMLDSHALVEVRSLPAAWSFIEARS